MYTGQPWVLPTTKCHTRAEVTLKAKWDELIQARIQVNLARRKLIDADMQYLVDLDELQSSGHVWRNTDRTTMEKYRLQFQIIDLDGDNLINYKEL